jgi:SSS family solute:Na+ symporter
MAYGTIEAYQTPGGGQQHFGGSVAPVFGHTTYIAVTAVLINLVVAVGLTLVFRAFRLRDGYDHTRPADYVTDAAPAAVAGARSTISAAP